MMYSAADVSNMIRNWKAAGLSRAELVVKIAEACMGWPYVWGSLGETDTPAKREYYMGRSSIGDRDRENILKRCQVLNGSASECAGCKYFPGGAQTRMFDCRGFTRWLFEQAGCGTIQGAGATSQYNTASNWKARGPISEMPEGTVCCVFQYNSEKNNMQHTGTHIGGGQIIHCSGEVKRDSTKTKAWTHYAIPKGIDGPAPGPTPEPGKPTIRRGSRGEYVRECQEDLIQLLYDVGPKGADGIFGAKTESAVRAFQQDHDLKPDGIVGPRTWEALISAIGPKKDLYTVTIRHLDLTQARALTTAYDNSEMKEED